MTDLHAFQSATLPELITAFSTAAPLMDAMTDTAVFIKDEHARYRWVNMTLAKRCGFGNRSAMIGCTAEEVFPARFGPQYTQQDSRILAGHGPLADKLELHLYYGEQPIWCLTQKLAVYDQAGNVSGIVGTSRDVQAPQASHPAYPRLAQVAEHIQAHYEQAITLVELTEIAGLSVAQLERHCKRIFQLTPRQMIHKARLGEATRLLRQELPITEIALRCGYTDHSAFSRQFKALTGLSPSQYRQSQQR
jgi:AraC-like DNA-binding protein